MMDGKKPVGQSGMQGGMMHHQVDSASRAKKNEGVSAFARAIFFAIGMIVYFLAYIDGAALACENFISEDAVFGASAPDVAAKAQKPAALKTKHAAMDFARLIVDERAYYYQNYPGSAPFGEARPVADHLQAVKKADYERRQKNDEQFLKRLYAIDRAALSTEEQLNYDLFAFMLEERLVFAKHQAWRIPFVSDSGFHTELAYGSEEDSFRSLADYHAYLQRLRAIPGYIDDQIANMRLGIETGWTMPKRVMEGLLPSFEALLIDKPEDSSFFAPFIALSENIGEADQKALQDEARMVIARVVGPALKALFAFMRDVYVPEARASIGVEAVPGGAVYYQDMVRYYTTLDVTPEAVHALGLAEVARIRSEMEAVIKEAGFAGSFEDFINFLRQDPQFYAKTEEELLKHASYIAKKIDGAMPSLFTKLPRQPYSVEAVPREIAAHYTTGRYVPAPLDSDRGGRFWVNSYALDKRPLYVLPALTLHEAVPGHHHQIALSQELEHVPDFRRALYPHAYGEGWGLYAEKLGLDIGIYLTPYEQFGRLSYEMWRACRLVIDTGIHHKGWTRDEAVALLRDNSALSLHNIATEVDRYISWPGQALAYKMGELTFLRLRAEAKQALGARFDLRRFHDALLADGGVPMRILEARMKKWVKAEQAR